MRPVQLISRLECGSRSSAHIACTRVTRSVSQRTSSMSKHILVTGGNSGIGKALCQQLVERGCYVFLGARSEAKGQDAVADIAKATGKSDQISAVLIDVTDEATIKTAAETIQKKLEPKKLYGLVNNAGIGFNTGLSAEEVVNTNLWGPKRVTDAFLSLLCPKMGRIVMTGSGSGPSYVQGVTDVETKRTLCSPDVTMDFITEHAKSGSAADTFGGYGLSKALLTCYTMVLAREHPNITSSIVSPGFILTKMTDGYGASKTPEEGTVSLLHCLFEKLDGNGWYYGSDANRSPLHFMRNPGEPEYDGVIPF